jgi:predicted DNA-binding ribbon-helix-helix protein
VADDDSDKPSSSNRNPPPGGPSSRLDAILEAMEQDDILVRRLWVGGRAVSIPMERQIWTILEGICQTEDLWLPDVIETAAPDARSGPAIAKGLRLYIMAYLSAKRAAVPLI